MAAMRFLKPTEVIERLRATIKGMEKNIGGADDFTDVDDNARLATPALYVTLAASNTATNITLQTGLEQEIIHGFDIILHLDKTDRRGQYAEDVATNFKMALIRSLNGWLPDPSLASSAAVNCSSTVLFLTGDQLIVDDRADYFRSFTFAQEYTFRVDDDGLGMIGNYDDLDDFDELSLDMLVGDGDVDDVEIELTGIHE